VGQVLSGSILFPWGDAPAVLERFSGLMEAAPDELAGAAILSLGPGGNPVVVVSPTWNGDPERGRQIVSNGRIKENSASKFRMALLADICSKSRPLN
jgi:hypothetical protein